MKKIIKFIPLIYIFLFVLAGCQNVKEGLAGSKKSNNDEFLVEKKSPLTLPPDFDKLPEPQTMTPEPEANEDIINLKNILKKEELKSKKKSTSKKSNSSLEKTILEKIKSN